MAFTAVAPLLVGAAALGALAQCDRSDRQAVVSGPSIPVIRTRMLEAAPMASDPPKASAELESTAGGGEGSERREGGVPESLVVFDDCRVRAVWWVTHLCGLTAKGTAAWMSDKKAAFTTVTLEGVGRTNCPPVVTRFETVLEGLSNGSYRFGTARRAVPFTIRCAEAK